MNREVAMSEMEPGHLPHGHRKFYDINKPSETIADNSGDGSSMNKQKDLLAYIDDNVLGREKTFSGPYGLRKVVYCDYVASGRSLKFIEDYIRDEVLPEYGNTHTTTSVTSLQTTMFRHEARDIIRNAVNASEHDAVIFVGSGCTGAVHKLIHALNMQQPPVVFVGPYEHHSNLLPWRETGARVIRVRETDTGLVDLADLKQHLQTWQGQGRQLLGCFSAASNVTGILAEVDAITACLHDYGALAFWDYAAAAPYVEINMNPVVTGQDQGLVYKDAIYFSPHKFVGGVQTPGILIAKKTLFQNPVPSGCGGGTVFFVRREGQRYLQEAEVREEGGTPDIVGAIRASLVFQLKEAVGADTIMRRDEELFRKALTHWGDVPSLVLLGNTGVPRLPIFSFVVRHPESGLLLHHNFICTLLNDLFGVQARGGCACAGPYAEDLLGIDEELAKKFEDLLLENDLLDRVHLRRREEYSEREILRPGFARLNLPYFMDEDSLQFVLEAVKMVAEYGWKLLPQYNFHPDTGAWRHLRHQVFKDRKWLGYISYREGRHQYHGPRYTAKDTLPSNHAECMQEARDIFEKAKHVRTPAADNAAMFDDEAEKYRWFLLPSEAARWLHDADEARSGMSRRRPVFKPVTYPTEVAGGRASVLFAGSSNPALSPEPPSGSHARVESPTGNPELNSESRISGARQTPEDAAKETAESRDSFQQGFLQWYDRLTPEGHGEVETPSNPDGGDVVEGDLANKVKATARANVSEAKRDENKNQNEAATKEISDAATETQEMIPTATGHRTTTDLPPSPISPTSHDATKDSSEQKSHAATAINDVTNSPAIQNSGATTPGTACVRKAKTVAKDATNDSEKDVDGKANGPKWYSPPKVIFKPFLEAVEEYGMLRDGDKVLVCLSGGKDSLSLLHAMWQYKFYARQKGITFDLGAVTVDPQTAAYDPSPLKGYLARLGVPYFYEEQCILETAEQLPYACASICSFCSRLKRGRIYHAARREGYNVLALGQHLDDLCESFLMSAFHNGALRTMKAAYTVTDGDLRVIRPFVYVREVDLRRFAEGSKFPIIAENCPACFEAPKERHRMKQLLATQEILHPQLFSSLLAAIRPIMGINTTGVQISQLIGQLSANKNAEDTDIDQV